MLQVLIIATVFQLLSSLSSVAVPKLAGSLVDVAIKSDQDQGHTAQQRQQLNSAAAAAAWCGITRRFVEESLAAGMLLEILLVLLAGGVASGLRGW